MKIIRHRPGRRPEFWPDTPVRPPLRRALLVGIQYIRDDDDDMDRVDKLRGPHKDVLEMRELLIDCYSYLPEDIVVLVDTDEPEQIQPTRDNMVRKPRLYAQSYLVYSHETCLTKISAIKTLIDGAQSGDRFFFHYAGHAAQVENKNFSEEDGLDEYIIPSDGPSRMIKDNELRRHLVDPLPVGSNLVAIFDSCHSASLLDLEHLRCNQVYVPWISKGKRKSDSRLNGIGMLLDEFPDQETLTNISQSVVRH
ncbi:hypothetical protein DXG01_015254 [Tephrocybe rancida]|nr:hypothetical protein DXG01_015254 [Tephrocybe rancida]